MSVFICDKERLPFSIHSFLDFTAHTRSIFKIFRSMNLRNGSFLMPYNKLAFRVLSGIKHALGYRLVSLYLIAPIRTRLSKHSYSFIIQYLTYANTTFFKHLKLNLLNKKKP